MAAVTRTAGGYHDSSSARIRKIGVLTAGVYATGGESLTAAAFGMGTIDVLIMEPFTNGSVIVFAVYLPATNKLKFFDMAGNEVSNATDQSAYTARFEAIGH